MSAALAVDSVVSNGPSNENAASILRAVGSLLVALSGGQAGQPAAIEQTLASVQQAAVERVPVPATAVPPPTRTLRPTASYPQPQGPLGPGYVAQSGARPGTSARAPQQSSDGSKLLDDVDFVLQDARKRAQAMIDESIERARELIQQERASMPVGAGTDTHAFDDLRQGLRHLVTEVRDIQQRLGRIEQLICEQNDYLTQVKAGSIAPPAFMRPPYAEPQYAEAEAAPTDDEPMFDGETPAALAPTEPLQTAPRSTFSVVPPQRREWTAAVESATAEVEAAPAAPTYEQPADPGGGLTSAAPGSALVTFLPSEGPITLRVAPIAGFQGLMRVQYALARLPAVRIASVDAYSQGEARLRIELAEAADSDDLVDGLARALRSPARVEDASEVNRELVVTLR